MTGAVVVITRGHPLEIFQAESGRRIPYFRLRRQLGHVLADWQVVMRDLSPLISVTYSVLVGAALLFIPAYMQGLMNQISTYPASVWGGLFFLGFFGTVLGFLWFYQGIQHIGPTKAGLFINFVPISAIILSFLILKEPITLSLLVGVYWSALVYI